jgi:hypothetical protein
MQLLQSCWKGVAGHALQALAATRCQWLLAGAATASHFINSKRVLEISTCFVHQFWEQA